MLQFPKKYSKRKVSCFKVRCPDCKFIFQTFSFKPQCSECKKEFLTKDNCIKVI